jgi:hypothetical protein
MQQKFSSENAPRTRISADRVGVSATDTGGLVRGVEASPRGLIRSTLLAAGAALSVLAVFHLPAEYGIDPTGLGSVLGLTEMGLIKQQLYAEAEADAAGLGATTAPDPEVLARLDRIELQLAAIGAVIGAPLEIPATEASATVAAAAPAPAPVPEPLSEPVPDAAAEPAPDVEISAPAIEAAVAEAAAADWRAA